MPVSPSFQTDGMQPCLLCHYVACAVYFKTENMDFMPRLEGKHVCFLCASDFIAYMLCSNSKASYEQIKMRAAFYGRKFLAVFSFNTFFFCG